MKQIILVILWCLALVGCRDQSQNQLQQNQTARQVETERQEKALAEKHAEESEQRRTWWQSIASILGVASVVLLIVGIILGSKAKNDAGSRH